MTEAEKEIQAKKTAQMLKTIEDMNAYSSNTAPKATAPAIEIKPAATAGAPLVTPKTSTPSRSVGDPTLRKPFDMETPTADAKTALNNLLSTASTGALPLTAVAPLTKSTVEKAEAMGIPTQTMAGGDVANRIKQTEMVDQMKADIKNQEDEQWKAYPGGKAQAIKDGVYKLAGGKQVFDPSPEGKLARKTEGYPQLYSRVNLDTPKVEEKKGEGFDFDKLLKGAGGALGGLAGLIQAYAYGRTGNKSPTVIQTNAANAEAQKVREDELAKRLQEKAEDWKNQQALAKEQMANQLQIARENNWNDMSKFQKGLAMQTAAQKGVPWQNNTEVD